MDPLPLKEVTPLIGETIRNWHRDRAPRMGAALAYYITLIVGAHGSDCSRGSGAGVRGEGRSGASGVADPGTGRTRRCQGDPVFNRWHARAIQRNRCDLLGLATLFFGGTAAVTELRDALNTIWHVPDDVHASHARNLFNVVKERLQAFALDSGRSRSARFGDHRMCGFRPPSRIFGWLGPCPPL